MQKCLFVSPPLHSYPCLLSPILPLPPPKFFISSQFVKFSHFCFSQTSAVMASCAIDSCSLFGTPINTTLKKSEFFVDLLNLCNADFGSLNAFEGLTCAQVTAILNSFLSEVQGCLLKIFVLFLSPFLRFVILSI